MGQDRYECIVVGAGPAGSAAALTVAQENMSVLLLERGQEPGEKKLFAGTVHRSAMDEIIPAFWQEAPVERPVVSDELWLLDQTSAVKIGFTGLSYGKPPYNKFTVLRYKWDNWFAHKAVEAGVHLMTKKTVRRILFEPVGLLQKKAVGVELDTGETIYAQVIILAEGASAELTDQAGLRKQISPRNLSLQVMEIFHLPTEIIEDRFHLAKDEGAVIGMIGYPTSGIIGKGGLWVQKDTLTLTVAVILSQMIEAGLSPYQLLAHLKNHPLIKRLLKGAQTLEYGCHTVPKGGFTAIPKLYDHGIMVAGDAAGFVSGRRGADLAMLSGKYAGETAAQARARGDYSAQVLKAYENKLIHSFFYQDMKDAQEGAKYFNKYQDSDYLINKTANELAYEFFRVGLETKGQKVKKMRDEVLSIQPLFKSVEDFYEGIQHWGIF